MAPRKSSSLAGFKGFSAFNTKDFTSSSCYVVVRVVAVFAMFVIVVVMVVVPVIVIAMALSGIQEIRVDVELGVQVEAAQVEDLGNRHLAEVHPPLRCARVHVLQAVRQRVDLAGVHQVGLADEDLVGEAHLAAASWRASSWPSACLAWTSVRIESSRYARQSRRP